MVAKIRPIMSSTYITLGSRTASPKKNVKSPKKYVQGLASRPKCANFAQKL